MTQMTWVKHLGPFAITSKKAKKCIMFPYRVGFLAKHLEHNTGFLFFFFGCVIALAPSGLWQT